MTFMGLTEVLQISHCFQEHTAVGLIIRQIVILQQHERFAYYLHLNNEEKCLEKL